MKLQVARRITGGFLLAVVISAAAGILIYRRAMEFRDNRQALQHSHQTLQALQDVAGEMEGAESATRVYVLTGEASYLQPYESAVSDYRATLQALQSLIADSPAQRDRMENLQRHVETGVGILQHLVETRRTQGMAAVLMQLDPEANRRELDAISGTISAMRGEENRVLEQRQRKYDASVRRTSEIFAAGVVIQCLLLLLVCTVFLRDATFRAQASQELESTNARLAAILGTTGDGIYQLDEAGRVLYLNRAGEHLLGYNLDEIRGKKMHDLIHSRTPAGELRPAENCRFLVAMRNGEPYTSAEDWYRRKDGSFLTIQCTSVPLRTEGVVSGAVFSFHDITEQKKAEAILRDSEAKLRGALEREKNVARIDFLTGVLNRRGFYEMAGTESQRSRRYKRPLSLVYVDIDNFKGVNDSLGHESGDELLTHVAAAIQGAVRGTDVVGRLGGDEFSVLLPETDHENGMVVVEKVRRQLRESMRKRNWPVTFSVGVTSFRTAPESVDEMIREADRVMYSVKLKGKDAVAAQAVG